MKPETDLEIALSALTLPVAQHADRNSEKFTLDEGEATDPNHITFAEPFDATNPIHWTIRKKWMVTGVMSATAFIRITSSTIMAPALGPIAQDLHMSSLEAQMALSVYLLASAFGPLVLSPLSELYGRKPVLHASNIWFLVWNLACGFAETKGVLIAARGFAGFGGSVAYAVRFLVDSTTRDREHDLTDPGNSSVVPSWVTSGSLRSVVVRWAYTG